MAQRAGASGEAGGFLCRDQAFQEVVVLMMVEQRGVVSAAVRCSDHGSRRGVHVALMVRADHRVLYGALALHAPLLIAHSMLVGLLVDAAQHPVV